MYFFLTQSGSLWILGVTFRLPGAYEVEKYHLCLQWQWKHRTLNREPDKMEAAEQGY